MYPTSATGAVSPAIGLGCCLVVTGKSATGTGWSRRVRPPGLFWRRDRRWAFAVFDVIAAPACAARPGDARKAQGLQRGMDMVLAGHYTPVHESRLAAATLETVTLDRPLRAHPALCHRRMTRPQRRRYRRGSL
jgi:hypothetical protein